MLTAATVPQIVEGLKKLTCAQGKAARFEAVIRGQPPPEVTWSDLLLHSFTLQQFFVCSQLIHFMCSRWLLTCLGINSDRAL